MKPPTGVINILGCGPGAQERGRRQASPGTREETMMPDASEWTQRRPYNAVADFVDAHVARGLSDKVAFIEGQRTPPYGELAAATCRCAGGLEALGLRQESRIVLLLLDTVDYPIAFWGALRAGIVPIPLNTLLTPEQYAYILED